MVAVSGSVRSGTDATVMRVRILATVWLQWSRLERLTTTRRRSWQLAHFSATSALPSPSGRSLGSTDALRTSGSGMRCGHAGGNIAPCLLVSDRPTFAFPLAVTLTLANQSL